MRRCSLIHVQFSDREIHLASPFAVDQSIDPLSVNSTSTTSDSSAGAPSVAALQTQEVRWFLDEVRPHEPALRTWLRAHFPSLSDIDDLVQETYARLFRARKAGRIAEVRPYLFATARNTASSIFRRRKIVSFEPIIEGDESSVVDEGTDVAETIAREQELAMLSEAISVLPARCRQVLTLRKLHGLSHREIAEMLGISENTVNAHAALGVLRCREYLVAKGYRKGGRG